MIAEYNLILSLQEVRNLEQLSRKVASLLKLPEAAIEEVEMLKLSLDARSKIPFYNARIRVYTEGDGVRRKKFGFHLLPATRQHTVIVCGAGPAGIFAALRLMEAGIRPVIIERGRAVDYRKKDIVQLGRTGELNTESNYCFGEGGAGCYSDGKLFTRSNKRGDISKVLNLLVYYGANPEIRYLAHPHIGSDRLPRIMRNIRSDIEKHGGEFHFETKVNDFILRNGRCEGVRTQEGKEFLADAVLLATGHSAHDIYEWFAERNYCLENKAFAMGVRLEHPQELINRMQYGRAASMDLPTASYSFSTTIEGRGVFSFCMCPGGVIIPASTEKGGLVVNGMSASARSSVWANSGMVVGVGVEDYLPLYPEKKALAGLYFQRDLERKFYDCFSSAPFAAPAQRMQDFIDGKISGTLPKSSYSRGCFSAPMEELLPKFISTSLKRGWKVFATNKKSFLTNEALLVGLESRTSSPVRIPRNAETLEYIGIENLYPCGEGAGYAGGITSSALDGMNAAQAIVEKLKVD